MVLAIGGKRHAHKDRGADLYETPPAAVRALIEHEALPRCIWEPACGPGAIVRILRAEGFRVFASDLNDWACPDSLSRVDFLMEQQAPVHIQAIVTNPPYMYANAFIYNAFQLVPRVYMLLPLQYMEGGQKDWRRDSLLDGGHLARVLPFRERLPMMHRHGWTGKKAGSSRCYAWFVWDRAHSGPTISERISLKKGMARSALNEKAA